MMQSLITAPYVTAEKINTLFIELTSCGIENKLKKNYYVLSEKNSNDFISFDVIKNTLSEMKDELPEFISFVGGEPLLHPDFNKILRYSLNYSNVVIYTNAGSINDKKARFLKKVEEENSTGHEIIFMIKIDYADEAKNDACRGRGSFRKAIHAMQSLIKYGFNPIMAVTDRENRSKNDIKDEFKSLCESFGFETSDINYKIMPYINTESEMPINDDFDVKNFKGDCIMSRTLNKNGIFSCPMLSSDYRGKCGNKIKDCEPKMYLETPSCSYCMNNNDYVYLFDET